ncbi:MAG: PilZ domain-containing protein [Candidatus Omnitrophica bacterium]|nr:PilZ domain-containing protein [Candidatus Omnitrophota bacterium]
MKSKVTYSYLKDPRALAEIRKHKWFLSQEAKREIGFATAAIDWVKKYGEAWQEKHVKGLKDLEYFLERRKYRRFDINTELRLRQNDSQFLARVININYFGLLCRTQHFLYLGNNVNVELAIKKDKECRINCNGIVERFSALPLNEYELYVRFDDKGQQQIEDCLMLG